MRLGILLVFAAGAAQASGGDFGFRDVSACNKPDEPVMRPAKVEVKVARGETVILVDALFNCAGTAANPDVAYSSASTTVSVEQKVRQPPLRCLCKRLLEFTLPKQLGRGTPVYFKVDGNVTGEGKVR